MTPLRRRMLEDMQMRGLSERTQQTYLAAVQQLAFHYDLSPDLLTEEQIRQYFLVWAGAAVGAPAVAPTRNPPVHTNVCYNSAIVLREENLCMQSR